MIKLIAIFIVILALTGVIYSKFTGFKLPQIANNTLLEERVKALENSVVSMRANLVVGTSASPKLPDYEGRITSLEKEVSKLKNQKISYPATVVNKSPLYIPLGSGGTAGDKGWYSVPGYEILADPGDYQGYSGMQLEVNFRMTEIAGVGMARLYNQTDNSAVSGEISIASDNFSLQVTPSFKLPGGRKTYRLQIKSTYGANLEIQSARIKVSF